MAKKNEQVVVASTHGFTAHRAQAALAGTEVEVIAVTIAAAYGKEEWTMKDAERVRGCWTCEKR